VSRAGGNGGRRRTEQPTAGRDAGTAVRSGTGAPRGSRSGGVAATGARSTDRRGVVVSSPHVLIVVQNLPVPLDRRVWLECRALRAAGYEVSVICPKGPGDPGHEVLEGVHLHKYRPAPPTVSAKDYVVEFAYSWVRTALLSLRVNRRRRIDVLQACNPPDTYWLLALLWKVVTRGRVRFVFDHHDLNPEVYLSRFGTPTGRAGRLQLAGLRWLERRTFATADQVISTNESYRRIAIERGGVDPARTAVVRSGPDTTTMRPVQPDAGLRRGRSEMLVYLGVMGPQDGVDIVLRVAHILVTEYRRDVHVALLGFGDCLGGLRDLAVQLGLSDRVTFTGRADRTVVADYLSAADVGISPDPLSPLNDVSTMNKTMEYLAYALPVVAFDLVETRVSAGGSAVYVDPQGDRMLAVKRFAAAVSDLLDDPARRASMALAGRRRAESVLDWRPQRVVYTATMDRLTGWTSVPVPPDEVCRTDEQGRPYLNLDDERAARDLVAARSRPRKAAFVPEQVVRTAVAGAGVDALATGPGDVDSAGAVELSGVE
jgi:glycosyltransferase involved in cell wall biosynthesis